MEKSWKIIFEKEWSPWKGPVKEELDSKYLMQQSHLVLLTALSHGIVARFFWCH